MDLKIWVVDAFADRNFTGNPAAIMPLERWLPDALMQTIAAQNNLSETAFFVAEPARGAGHYRLRWFTPEVEVALCGHATLASAHVLFHDLQVPVDDLVFRTESGDLRVTRGSQGSIAMDFPGYDAAPRPDSDAFAQSLGAALGRAPVDVFQANYPLAVYAAQTDVAALAPAPALADTLSAYGETGLIVAALADAGQDCDIVTRFFAPAKGILEDPVTGSAHCAAAPFFARRLGRERIRARQISARGGLLDCTVKGARVILVGRCAPYLRGVVTIQT